MDLFGKIQTNLERQAREWDTLRQRFKIPFRNNAYPERAVSLCFMLALRDVLPNSVVIPEVPFSDMHSKRYSNHLDALVFNDDTTILAEFKRSFMPRHWLDLARDVERVGQFAEKIQERFTPPRNCQRYGFYGMDTWKEEAANAWISSSEEPHPRWKTPDVFRTMKRGKVVVWSVGAPNTKKQDFDGYYWLFALEKFSDATPAAQVDGQK